jgi:hypothetical protein
MVAVDEKRYMARRHEQFATDAMGQTLEEKMIEGSIFS